jgi:hypothetical protein
VAQLFGTQQNQLVRKLIIALLLGRSQLLSDLPIGGAPGKRISLGCVVRRSLLSDSVLNASLMDHSDGYNYARHDSCSTGSVASSTPTWTIVDGMFLSLSFSFCLYLLPYIHHVSSAVHLYFLSKSISVQF